MKKLLLFLIIPFFSFGQEILLQELEKYQARYQPKNHTSQNIKSTNNDSTYIFPVVVHIFHYYDENNLSYDQINHALFRLNEDFNGLNEDLAEVIPEFTNIIGYPNFQFRLATKDPNGSCTYGITRNHIAYNLDSEFDFENIESYIELVNWPSDQYINIYVIPLPYLYGITYGGSGIMPGSSSSQYGDYIFCRPYYFGDWNLEPTGDNYSRHFLSHIMGHFFNLFPIWGGYPGAIDDYPGGSNCWLDDGIADTPLTIGTDGNAVSCPLDQATCDGSLDNVQNIMDMSSCRHMFTQGQSDKMIDAANSLVGDRWYLWQEDNLIATGTDDETFNADDTYIDCFPIPDFNPINSTLTCENNEVQFENYTYNDNDLNTSYFWEFEGGSPANSNNENPIVSYNYPGSYDVSLTTCNNDNCNTIIRENLIIILSQMNVSASDGFSQGFESQTFPVMGSEVWWGGNSYGEQHWEITPLASSEGGSSIRITSQNYGSDRYHHAFSTPVLNLAEFTTSGSDPLMLCFDIAYAKRLPYNIVSLNQEGLVNGPPYSIHNDALIISYKGCGDSAWSERPWIYTRPGQAGAFPSQQQSLFTTGAIYPNNFIPDEDEWQQRCITIQQLAGDDEAIIKFEFKGTGQGQSNLYLADCPNGPSSIEVGNIGGNWLYLDNIRIANASVMTSSTSSPGPASWDECLADADCDYICDSLDNCIWLFNPEQIDSDNDGIGDDCDSTPLSMNKTLNNNKSIIKIIDILGRENNTNKGFQLHIYDDGSVEKKYILK